MPSHQSAHEPCTWGSSDGTQEPIHADGELVNDGLVPNLFTSTNNSIKQLNPNWSELVGCRNTVW